MRMITDRIVQHKQVLLPLIKIMTTSEKETRCWLFVFIQSNSAKRMMRILSTNTGMTCQLLYYNAQLQA